MTDDRYIKFTSILFVEKYFECGRLLVIQIFLKYALYCCVEAPSLVK